MGIMNTKSAERSASVSRRDVFGRFTRFLLAVCEAWYYPGPIL